VPDFVGNCAGVSFSTGTEDYLTEAGTGRHQRIDEVLTEGQEVSYYAASSLTAVTGYETGIAIWRDSTNILEVQSITTSSNGGGKVYWPAGGVVIYVTASVAMLNSLANLTAGLFSKPAGEPIVIFATGQSEMYGLHTADTPLYRNDRVFVYSPATALTGTRAWRVADPTAPSLTGDVPNNFTVFTGYTQGGRGNIAIAMAQRLQEQTGRDVYVYMVVMSGAAITQWDFLGSAEVFDRIYAEWPTASAALPVGAPSYADFALFSQGYTDGYAGMLPSYWVSKCLGFFDRISRPGIFELVKNQSTRKFIVGQPSGVRMEQRWDGSRFVDAWTGNDTTVVSMDDYPLEDQNHITGDAAVNLGQRIATLAISSAALVKSRSTGFRLVRPTTTVPTTQIREADGPNTVAPAAIKWNYDGTANTVSISAFTTVFGSTKLDMLTPNTEFRFTQTDDATKSVTFTIDAHLPPPDDPPITLLMTLTGPPVVGAGGWPDVAAHCTGGIPINAIYSRIQAVHDTRPEIDAAFLTTEERVLLTRLESASSNFLNDLGNQVYGPAVTVDASAALGELMPSGTIHTRHYKQTTNATATAIITSVLPDNTRWGYLIHYGSMRNDYSAAGSASVRGAVLKLGAGVSNGAAGTVYGSSGTPPAPAVTQSGGSLNVTVTGIASQTWKHTVDVYMWPLATSA
jgi:hypothetical protein